MLWWIHKYVNSLSVLPTELTYLCLSQGQRSVSSLAFVRFLFRWVCQHDLHLDAINHFTMQQCYGFVSRFSVCVLYISHIPTRNQVNLHQGTKTTAWREHTHCLLPQKISLNRSQTILSNDAKSFQLVQENESNFPIITLQKKNLLKIMRQRRIVIHTYSNFISTQCIKISS